jgi:SulP family sulfate permease
VRLDFKDNLAADLWGALAATLVALPSAIAFGVTIFLPFGAEHAAAGALAGLLGTVALGLVAAACGGTDRLITAPCAPAAAVLAALAIEMSQRHVEPTSAMLMLAVVGLACGALQVLFGLVGLGRLIKYMPYPVVSGYLSGVGLIIIASQVPKLLGAPVGIRLWDALRAPADWSWQAITVGALTVAVMVLAPRLTKTVPAAILAMAAGVLGYLGLAAADPALLTLAGNPLVVGPFPVTEAGVAGTIVERWKALGALEAGELLGLATSALTLAVLLSIDTLKTCVVTDAITRTRHDSNRELVGQGLGNLASAAIGGIPGAGQMGATLVNISSGARTRLSGVAEGLLALVAFLALGSQIAWVPIAALAAILIVIGARMIDLDSVRFLRSRATALDFAVIAAVVVVAVTVGLIVASGVGIGLAILLFVREQLGSSVVHRKAYGNQMYSKQVRLPEEMEVLERRGDKTAVFELQGSLFFGTTDQLYRAIEPDLKTATSIILDMRRVQSVDVTAAHLLEQFEDMLAERGAFFIFSHLPRHVPSGKDLRQYFDSVGLVRPGRRAQVFDELDDALESVETRLLAEEQLDHGSRRALELREIGVFVRRKAETLEALETIMDKRSYHQGETIFRRGDAGDEVFLIRRGAVRVELPLGDGQSHHLATFRRGVFFGEMSFLDREPRSADAIAYTDVDLYVLSRARFDTFASEHKRLAIDLYEGIARSLAIRLRYTNAELRVLQMA